MAINETIVTGRKFRKLIDESTKLWQRISIWTKASDVEFNDGKTAENKVGAISGVTDSLTSTSSNIAASAAAVKALNDKVTELSSNLYLNYKSVYTTQWGSDPTVSNKKIALGSYGCNEALLVFAGGSTNANTNLNIGFSGCDSEQIASYNLAYGGISRLTSYQVYYLKNMSSDAAVTVTTYCRTASVELIKIN